MPNKNIEQFNSHTNINGGENVLAMSSGTTIKINLNTIKTFVNSGLQDYYVTGGTYTNNTVSLKRNDGNIIDFNIDNNNKWFIPSGTTLTVTPNSQSFIYGDLIVEGILELESDSQLVVLNGDIILDGGSISGDGVTTLIDLPLVNNYTTNAALVGSVAYFDRNDTLSAYTLDLSSLDFTGNTLDRCIGDLYVNRLHGCGNLNIEDNIVLKNGTSLKRITFSNNTFQDTGAHKLIAGTDISITESIVSNRNFYTINSTAVPGLSSINYSNVFFVDIYGNDATALMGRFDKPYLTIQAAINAAANTAPSDSTKALVYVRKGIYGSSVFLSNHVDIYCDVDVRLTSTWFLGSADVNCKILGYGSWFTTSTTRCFNISNSCNLYIEAVDIDSASMWGEFNTTNINFANIVINAKRIRSTGSGTGIGTTIRSNVNMTLNIKEYIKGDHSVFDIRTFSGKLVVNTPEIILGSVNVHGGNFKQCLILYSANVGSKIILNADLKNEQTPYLGGISGVITIHGAANGDIEVNGNIYANETIGIYGNVGSGTKLSINGNIKSNIRPIVSVGSGTILVRDAYIYQPSTSASPELVYINTSGNLMFKNCIFRNDVIDGSVIKKDTITGNVSFIDCIASTSGTLGYFITSPVAANTVRIHNVRADKPLHADVTDLLSPTGLIVDPNILTPLI